MDMGLYDLIEAVKNNPILYDNTLSDFKVPEKKIYCWEKIAKNLGTSEEECRKRWRTLRERYTRELKQMKFGSGAKTSSWEFFRHLGFLIDHIKYRKRFPLTLNRSLPIMTVKNTPAWSKTVPKSENYNRSDVEDEDLSMLDNEDFNQSTDNLPVEDDEYLVETLDNGVDYHEPEAQITVEPPIKMLKVDNLDKKTTSKTESEDDLFCSSVSCTLGKFSRLHNIKAKGEIMRVLEKYVEFEEASK